MLSGPHLWKALRASLRASWQNGRIRFNHVPLEKPLLGVCTAATLCRCGPLHVLCHEQQA